MVYIPYLTCYSKSVNHKYVDVDLYIYFCKRGKPYYIGEYTSVNRVIHVQCQPVLQIKMYLFAQAYSDYSTYFIK